MWETEFEDEVAVVCGYANARWKAGERTEAIATLRRLTSRYPENGTVWLTLGRMLEQIKGSEAEEHADAGLTALREAVRLTPRGAKARHELAIAEQRRGHHADAYRLYLEAHARAPDDTTVLTNLGNVCCWLERLEEALTWYERARQLAPANARVWREMGTVYQRRGEMDQALKAFRRSEALEPGQADTRLRLAIALQQVWAWKTSLKWLLRAKQAGASVETTAYYEALAHYRLASLASLRMRFKRAERHIRRSLCLQPEEATYWSCLGPILLGRGKRKAAERALTRAVRLATAAERKDISNFVLYTLQVQKLKGMARRIERRASRPETLREGRTRVVANKKAGEGYARG